MITRFATSMLLLLALVIAYADAEVDEENPAVKAVLRVQDQLHEFGIAGDGSSFGALISEDFVASDPTNTIRHRDEIVALVSSGRLRYESIETSSPTRQSLQPEATGAIMEATKWLKPLVKRVTTW